MSVALPRQKENVTHHPRFMLIYCKIDENAALSMMDLDGTCCGPLPMQLSFCHRLEMKEVLTLVDIFQGRKKEGFLEWRLEVASMKNVV